MRTIDLTSSFLSILALAYFINRFSRSSRPVLQNISQHEEIQNLSHIVRPKGPVYSSHLGLSSGSLYSPLFYQNARVEGIWTRYSLLIKARVSSLFWYKELMAQPITNRKIIIPPISEQRATSEWFSIFEIVIFRLRATLSEVQSPSCGLKLGKSLRPGCDFSI